MEQESLGWSAAAAALPDADTLRRLAKSEPADLSAAELIDFIVCAERLQSFVQALQISAVAEFARPGRCGDVSDLVDMLTEKGGRAKLSDGSIDVDVLEALVQEQTRRLAAAEIAAALRQSSIGAARRVDAALEYADELPATLRALREGRIDKARAWVIADRTGNLDPDLRNELESSIVPLAFDRTPGQLKPLVDRRVVAADPDAAKKRAEKARKERTVDHFPGDDGMGVIRAILSADGAVAVAELLDSMARATAGADDRPIAARRADALTDICISLLQDGFVDVGVVLGKVSDCGASESRTDAESFEEAGDAIVRIRAASQRNFPTNTTRPMETMWTAYPTVFPVRELQTTVHVRQAYSVDLLEALQNRPESGHTTAERRISTSPCRLPPSQRSARAPPNSSAMAASQPTSPE